MRVAVLASLLAFAIASPVAEPDAAPEAVPDVLSSAPHIEARAATYPVTAKTGLNCRVGDRIVRSINYGAKVPIECQIRVPDWSVHGNNIWNWVGDCWAADYYIKTGRSDLWKPCK